MIDKKMKGSVILDIETYNEMFLATRKGTMKIENDLAPAPKPTDLKPVSIHYDKDGEADGVRICSLDEDFVIKLHDEFDGKDVEWYEIGKKGVKTFNRKQAALISAYIKEVNEALKEAGGDVLDVWYWTNESCEASGYYAWYLYGNNGNLNYYYKYSAYRVRGVLA